MEQNNVTAKELSKALDFPYTTVLSWLKGDNYPRIDKIDLMADYFGVLKSDLIEDQKEKPVDSNDELSAKKRAFIEKVKQMSESELDRLDQILRIVENTK
jgi:transcriptional regulator with XRE-family HTH domain